MSAQARARAGKYTKPKRGGGKQFSRHTGEDGIEESIWAIRDKPRNEASSDEEEDDEDEDEDSEDDSDDSSAPKESMTREERKAAEKKRKEAAKAKKAGKPQPGDLPPNSSDEDDSEDDSEDEAGLPANPNHSAAARSQTKAVETKGAAPPAAAAPKAASGKTESLSRREREALAAQQSKERYAKLHAEGKTDEAKADLARLRLVKERREAEAARRKVEEEERVEQEKEKANVITDREAKLRAAAAGPSAKGKPLKKKK